MDELLDLVIGKLRESESEEPEFADVFTPEVIDRLAALPETDYEKFKVHLQAYLIINGIKVKNVTERRLDLVVKAAADRMTERAHQEMPPTFLSEACPDAPDAHLPLSVPPGWWMDGEGLGRLGRSGERLPAVCTSPVYVGLKVIDRERVKTLFKLAVKADGNWHHVFVSAGAGKKAMVNAVKNAGALVMDGGGLAGFLESFLENNWEVIPVEEKQEALFDEFKSFVCGNLEDIEKTKKGKVISAKNGQIYVAIAPEVLRRFARSAGADAEQALLAWQKSGYLVADSEGNATKTVSLNGRKRRMYVFKGLADGLKAAEAGQAGEG